MKLALALPFAVILAGCGDLCRNTPHQTVSAPDGSSTAFLFDRDCGATTGFTSQVSVAREAPSGGGNVFIADGGTNAASWGGPWVNLTWLGPKRLLVRYDATARIFVRNKNVGAVEVTFQPVRR